MLIAPLVWHKPVNGSQIMFKALFDKFKRPADPRIVHSAIVERAREPAFYRDIGVPDTFDGRYEMMIMHLYLVLERFKTEPDYAEFSQFVFDTFIDDISIGLREAGVGDTVVPKRLQKMTRVFYGRVKAWDTAFADENPAGALTDVLLRNMFEKADESEELTSRRLAHYMIAERESLKSLSADELTRNVRPFRTSLEPSDLDQSNV